MSESVEIIESSAPTEFGPTRLLTAGPAAAPPVVLLHGYAAAADQWRPLMRALGDRYRLLAPDLLGFGWAPMPPPPYRLERWLEQVDALLDWLGEQPLALVGHSMGGLVASETARRRPECLAALALIDPLGVMPSHFQHATRGPARRLVNSLRHGWPAERLFSWVYNQQRLLARPLALSAFHNWRRAPAEAVPEWRALISRPEARLAFLDVVRRLEHLTTDLHAGEVTVPALLVWGRQDRLLPASLVREWQARLPQAELLLLDGCGHLPHVERTEEVAAALTDLLGRAESS